MNAFTAIDQAVVKAIGEYPPMLAFRQSLRGGSGSGEDITTGPVPQRAGPSGSYDVQDSRTPAIFITRSIVTPLPTEAVAYSPVVTMVLPRYVDADKVTADHLQEAVDLVLQAAQLTSVVQRTSISDRLRASGYSSCSVYTFEHLGFEGGDVQPRVSARLRFQVPFQALTGRSLGVR